MLDVTGSWMVGSVALAVVSMHGIVGPRSNMNIIAPHKSLESWIRFFVESLGFTIVERIKCRGAYADIGGMFIKFKHEDIAVRSRHLRDVPQLTPCSVQENYNHDVHSMPHREIVLRGTEHHATGGNNGTRDRVASPCYAG
jgi:hypothetical protein